MKQTLSKEDKILNVLDRLNDSIMELTATIDVHMQGIANSDHHAHTVRDSLDSISYFLSKIAKQEPPALTIEAIREREDLKRLFAELNNKK